MRALPHPGRAQARPPFPRGWKGIIGGVVLNAPRFVAPRRFWSAEAPASAFKAQARLRNPRPGHSGLEVPQGAIRATMLLPNDLRWSSSGKCTALDVSRRHARPAQAPCVVVSIHRTGERRFASVTRRAPAPCAVCAALVISTAVGRTCLSARRARDETGEECPRGTRSVTSVFLCEEEGHEEA